MCLSGDEARQLNYRSTAMNFIHWEENEIDLSRYQPPPFVSLLIVQPRKSVNSPSIVHLKFFSETARSFVRISCRSSGRESLSAAAAEIREKSRVSVRLGT